MLYAIFSTIIFVLCLPFIYLLSLVKPNVIYCLKEKLGMFKSPKFAKKSILIYAISVGEVMLVKNLVKRLHVEYQDKYNIVLTTGTKTGQKMAKEKLGNIVDFITYFPYDFPPFIYLFLKKINPACAIVAETELWPNFSYILKKRNIPLFIVNGRISDRTYKSYKKLSFFFAPILKRYTKILTQSKQDNDKLISIGANPDNTLITGNLKFDIEPKVCDISIKKPENSKIIVAGSTHNGEDEIVLDSFMELKSTRPELKLLIAPRHPERNNDVFELMKKTSLKVGKRSNNDDFVNNDILILDTIGELSKVYALCDFAIIGGSFNKTGGHNPLEACVYNKPVLSGTCVTNFKGIFALLCSENVAKLVSNKAELIQAMVKLLDDREYYNDCCARCEKVLNNNKGALDNVLQELHSSI